MKRRLSLLISIIGFSLMAFGQTTDKEKIMMIREGLLTNQPSIQQQNLKADASTQSMAKDGALFFEDFSETEHGELPAGWTKQGEMDAAWGVNYSSSAGGVSPEMRLRWTPVFNGLSRLVTPEFNVGNHNNIRLKFKHYLNYYGDSGNTLGVQVSYDGIEWEDVWTQELTSSIPAQEKEISIEIPEDKTSIYLGWIYDGNSFDINDYNLDDILVEPVVENDLAAISITGNSHAEVGEPNTYTVTIRNAGSQPQDDYIVKLVTEEGIELASAEGVSLDYDETHDFEFTWTPGNEDVGNNTLFGEVVLSTDSYAGNDKTPGLFVFVQPAGITEITIGEGTNLSPYRIPFDFFWSNSFTQTIYYAEELDITHGVITSIAYTNHFNSDLKDKPIRIWIGETELDHLENGFVPFDELELVFEGNIDFPSGENTILIPFDNQYIYEGKNLVVYTNRVYVDSFFSSVDNFYSTEDAGSARTRHEYADGTEPLDPANPGPGKLMDWHPNTTFYVNSAGFGNIEGTVIGEENQPVQGVKVEIANGTLVTQTDEQGEFSFVLLPGEYTLNLEKYGYQSQTIENVLVEAEETTVLDDIVFSLVSEFTVSGIIKGNDELFLEDATITLDGYDIYTTNTNSNGEYTIENVYSGTYSVTVFRLGYERYTAEGIVIDKDLTMEPIVLDEVIIDPTGLAIHVEGQEQGNALFTWNPQGQVEFRYDDGIISGQLGFDGATDHSVVGAVHRNHAIVNSVSWFLTEEGGPNNHVTVWVIGLDELGEPNHYDVLYFKEDVANTNMQWNTLELPEAIETPNGFFIGVGAHGFVSLATDTGTDSQWPFMPNSNYAGNVTTGNFFTFESQGFHMNAMVRATGFDLGELEYNAKADQTPMVSDLVFVKNEEPVVTYNPRSIPATKEFVGFTVLLDGEVQTQGLDTNEYLFTDLEEGIHTAGVKAVYTTGSSNIVNIGFGLDFGVNVKFNITNNSGDSPEGATVSLVGGEYSHSGVADAEGKVEFPVVYRGTYNISVSLAGHEVYADDYVNIQDAIEFNVELQETTEIPFGLVIEQLNSNVDVKFSWNNAVGFTDDFESYDDFIIDNIGEYTLYDGDGSSTYHFNGIEFPNSGYVGSYIIFNPSQTNPPIEGDAMAPHSGEKFIACFNGIDWANNDWLITAKFSVLNGLKMSFWAKTYMDYGLEEFRVAISTTDTNPESFEFITDVIQAPVEGWHQYEYDLSEYAGQDIYAAIVCLSDDVFVFMVDDLEIGLDTKKRDNILAYTQHNRAFPNVQNASKAFLGYKVYLNNQLVSGDNPIPAKEFIFEGLEGGETYIAGVSSVYTSGETDIETIQFTTQATYDIIGKVVDSDTDEAIANVEVQLGSQTESTNEVGEFTFNDVLDGEYTLTITHEGYDTYTQKVDTEDATGKIYDLGTIKLIPASGIMDESFAAITSYPNPFDNYITISNPELVKRVVVTNSVGQRVMDVTLNGEGTVNTETLVQGIYLITLQGENGETLVRRMIKK